MEEIGNDYYVLELVLLELSSTVACEQFGVCACGSVRACEPKSCMPPGRARPSAVCFLFIFIFIV